MAARDGRWERKGGVCDQVRRHRLRAAYGYERLEWVMTLEGQPVRGHEINGVVAEIGQTWRRLGRSILYDVHHVVHQTHSRLDGQDSTVKDSAVEDSSGRRTTDTAVSSTPGPGIDTRTQKGCQTALQQPGHPHPQRYPCHSTTIRQPSMAFHWRRKMAMAKTCRIAMVLSRYWPAWGSGKTEDEEKS